MDDNAIPESPLGEEPRKRLVRNYLLDAGLQLRYASYLVAVAAAISLALGWMLWSAYRETSRVIALGDPQIASGLSSTLASVDRTRMLWLIAGLIAVVLCLLVFAVVVTHRVAGGLPRRSRKMSRPCPCSSSRTTVSASPQPRSASTWTTA